MPSSTSQSSTKATAISTMSSKPLAGVLKSRLAFTLARAMRGILPLFSALLQDAG